jgi:hypothetical protein
VAHRRRTSHVCAALPFLNGSAAHTIKIEELRLNQCNEVTAEGVAQVLMRAGSRIRSIHVIGCPQLGDDFALAVAQHCPQIRELILSAAGVTDVSVAVLATQCNHLRVLSLYECMSVTMPGECALAEHCDELRYLHLPSTLQGQHFRISSRIALQRYTSEIIGGQ